MNFYLTILATGNPAIIDITKNDYIDLKNSKNSLSAAMEIEGKYELLISNYMDLEKSLTEQISEYMIRPRPAYSEFFDIKLVLNRRIVNLLTSTKLYYDQVLQNIKTCIPNDSNAKEKAEKLFSIQYDSCFEYRFIEALRNYVQHKSLPIHLVTLPSKRIDTEDDFLLEYRIVPYTLKSELEEDEGFKKSVINEMTEEVEIIFAIRAYISAFSKINTNIRELIDNNIGRSRELIKGRIHEYQQLNRGNATGLSAVQSNNNGSYNKIVEKISMLLDWDDIRIKLAERNKPIINLEKRYISSDQCK